MENFADYIDGCFEQKKIVKICIGIKKSCLTICLIRQTVYSAPVLKMKK